MSEQLVSIIVLVAAFLTATVLPVYTRTPGEPHPNHLALPVLDHDAGRRVPESRGGAAVSPGPSQTPSKANLVLLPIAVETALTGGPQHMTELVQRRAVAVEEGTQSDATIDGRDDAPVTLVLSPRLGAGPRNLERRRRRTRPSVAGGEFRMGRYDQRGHGRSTWGSPASVSIDLLDEDLAAVLDETVSLESVVLAGQFRRGSRPRVHQAGCAAAHARATS